MQPGVPERASSAQARRGSGFARIVGARCRRRVYRGLIFAPSCALGMDPAKGRTNLYRLIPAKALAALDAAPAEQILTGWLPLATLRHREMGNRFWSNQWLPNTAVS